MIEVKDTLLTETSSGVYLTEVKNMCMIQLRSGLYLTEGQQHRDKILITQVEHNVHLPVGHVLAVTVKVVYKTPSHPQHILICATKCTAEYKIWQMSG